MNEFKSWVSDCKQSAKYFHFVLQYSTHVVWLFLIASTYKNMLQLFIYFLTQVAIYGGWRMCDYLPQEYEI